MKTIRIILGILLSLLLITEILCAETLFASSKVFEEESLNTILSQIDTGKKIMDYEYLSEEIDSTDIYEQLAQAIPAQVALSVNVSGQEAVICQDGALQQIAQLEEEKYAYTSFDSVAEDLAEAYVQTAIAQKIISPGKTISYKDSRNQRVYARSDTLLQETIVLKYKTILEKLKEEGFFCSLDIDGKNAIVYLMRCGKKAAEAKNGLYRSIENKISEIFNAHFADYIRCLKDRDPSYALIAQQDLNGILLSEVYSYIHSLDISQEKLRTDRVNASILLGISQHIAPKLYTCLPSYKDTLAALGETGMSLAAFALNGRMFSICLAAAVMTMILLLLIGKGKALFYIGVAFLLSGAAALSGRSASVRLPDIMSTSLATERNDLSFLMPDLVKAVLEHLFSIGIYIAAFGILLLAASFLFKKKKA